jgi:hypothetical protein
MRVLRATKITSVALLLLAVLALLLFSQVRPTGTDPETANLTPASDNAPDCVLTIDKAPRLRGFYLNQTAEEIGRVFPSFLIALDKKKRAPIRNGVTTSDFWVVASSELSEGLSEAEDYRDVAFVWQLLNGRTVGLTVEYREFEPESLQDLLAQIADTTFLPIESFKVIGVHNAVMTCDGFTVSVHEGSYSETEWMPVGSQILLEDKVAFQVVNAEENEAKRLSAEEAAKKKEEAEKRRRTFKP